MPSLVSCGLCHRLARLTSFGVSVPSICQRYTCMRRVQFLRCFRRPQLLNTYIGAFGTAGSRQTYHASLSVPRCQSPSYTEAVPPRHVPDSGPHLNRTNLELLCLAIGLIHLGRRSSQQVRRDPGHWPPRHTPVQLCQHPGYILPTLWTRCFDPLRAISS